MLAGLYQYLLYWSTQLMATLPLLSPEPHCSSCKHYLPEIPEKGLCRRYPPTPIAHPTPQGVGVTPFYPQVLADNLCGEYVRKVLLNS